MLERASARETSRAVAVGAIAKLFLREMGIEVLEPCHRGRLAPT